MAERQLGKGESLQVRSPVIIGVMAGILALVIIVAFGFELVFPARIGQRFVPHHPFPAPAVIANERQERLDLEARQRRALDGAGGRIPIGEAMREIVQRGPHAFDPEGP